MKVEGSDRSRTVSSEVKFAGRKVRLRVDTIELGRGRRTTREVVEHPGAVGILARAPCGGLVLVEQYRYPLGRTILEIPAGTLEPGEDPAACARRELEEETGYRAGSLVPLLRCFPSPGVFTEEMHLFYADDLAEGCAAPEEGEILRPVTLAPEDVLDRIRTNEIVDGKTIVAVLFASRWGFLKGSDGDV